MSNSSTAIPVSTKDAPAALGAYTQAVKAGGFVFVSACGPMIPATGEIVEGGIKAQTKQALTNMEAILSAAGSSISQIVKATIFIQNLSDFQEMNTAYAEFFNANSNPDSPKPARSLVETRLPKPGMLVGFDCQATY